MKAAVITFPLLGLCLATLLAVAPPPAAAAERNVTIGTGGPTAVYYVVGQAICLLVNRENAKNGLACTAEPSAGSVANLKAIADGGQDIGVVQSDMQYHAYRGDAPKTFPGGADKDLRALFSLYLEAFTVVARKDSGIATFDDLKGKRVNVGNPGSGARVTLEILMDRLGWKMSDFMLAAELPTAEQAAALCDGAVDAIVFTVGHPSGTIKKATSACDSTLIPVTGTAVDKLVSEEPYYSKTTIPGGTYTGTGEDVATFGVRATVVSSTRTDAEAVYWLVKAVFDNFDRFKRLHPAFAALDEKKMIGDNLAAPLHPGAVKYYKERGWM